MPDRGDFDRYSIVETPEFLRRVEEILGSVERWDDAKWARDWTLERNPRVAQYIADDDTWALMYQTSPPIVVYYRIDEDLRLVTVLDVFVSPFE